MWSRVVEVMLGVWLLMSPFIFSHPDAQTSWWANDFISGAVVVHLALFSFWRRTERAHLLLIAVGFWLIGFAYFNGFGDPPAAMENNAIIGILLLMFAIIPNEASQPPKSWDERRAACPEPATENSVS